MKKFSSALLAAFVCFTSGFPVRAAGEGILSDRFSDGVYTAYIRLADDDMEIVSAAAEGQKIKTAEFRKTDDSDQVKTTVIADRSSLKDEGGTAFSEMLKEILSLSGENESFRLVTAGTDGTVPVTDFTRNQLQILNAAENTEPENEAADIRRALKSFCEKMSAEADGTFSRVIVFTSGENLNSFTQEAGEGHTSCLPFYYVLTDGAAVPEQSISSLEGFAGYCSVSPGSDFRRAASLVSGMSDVYFLSAEIPDDIIGAGGLKRISITVENSTRSLSFEKMTDTGDRRYEAAEKSAGRLKVLLAVITLTAFVLAGILAVVLRKRKYSDIMKDHDRPGPHYTVPLSAKRDGSSTVFGTASTRILFRDGREYRVVLTDTDNPERVIEISSANEAVIGRNQSLSDIVIYNERSVSQKHCRIFSRNSKIYVEDLGSLNHTFVDGEEITRETELFSGSVLKIGRVSFSVEIQS